MNMPRLGRTSLLAITLLLGVMLPGVAQTAKISGAGLFSYQAPSGFQAQDTPISKFPVAMAPAVNGFAPNINVVAENFPKPLADYVKANRVALTTSPVFVNLKILSETPFQTTSGVKGARLLVSDTLGKLNMQQIFYVFAANGYSKLVVTASCSIGDGDHYAPIFDEAMKTMTLP